MKILVTGGCGFIGRHLVRSLVDKGHEVVVWDTAPGEPFNDERVTVRLHDVQQLSYLGCFDVIYHLAAVSRIAAGLQDVERTYQINVEGTRKLLRDLDPIKTRFVYVSSYTVHRAPTKQPYSFSKKLGEDLCHFYRVMRNIDCVIVRPSTVYGPGQASSGPSCTVIGIWQEQKRLGMPITVVGDGNQVRNFVHVSDVVNALVGLLDISWSAGAALDIGSGSDVYSIKAVAAMFRSEIQYLPSRDYEEPAYYVDTSAARALGLGSKIKLQDYVEEFLREVDK